MEPIILAQLIASLATLVTLIVLLYQVRMQTVSTDNQVYQNFVSNSLSIDNVLIEHPEMREYVYGDTPIDPKKVDVPLLMSIIELMIDVMENIEVFKKQIPKERLGGWMNFVSDVKQSSAYKYYMSQKEESWYIVEDKH